MNKEAARLKAMAQKMGHKKPETTADSAPATARQEVHPPHGQKGDFVKLSVTLPPDVYELLNSERGRRKAHKEANANVSAIIRESVMAYLEK